MIENKQSSADHTLHLSPSHGDRAGGEAPSSSTRGRQTRFSSSRERRPRDRSTPHCHPAHHLVSGATPPDEPGEEPELGSVGIIPGWEPGGAPEHTEGTHVQRHTRAPVQPRLGSGAWLLGESQLNLTFPSRTQDPAPTSSGDLEKEHRSEHRCLHRVPRHWALLPFCPGPRPGHPMVLKAHFIWKDNTNVLPSLLPCWPLPECVSLQVTGSRI